MVSQVLIDVVRAGCDAAAKHLINMQPCDFPLCGCQNNPTVAKAALASILKRDPSEEMLSLLRDPPETGTREERDWYEYWYSTLQAQLLRELGLEDEPTLDETRKHYDNEHR